MQTTTIIFLLQQHLLVNTYNFGKTRKERGAKKDKKQPLSEQVTDNGIEIAAICAESTAALSVVEGRVCSL